MKQLICKQSPLYSSSSLQYPLLPQHRQSILAAQLRSFSRIIGSSGVHHRVVPHGHLPLYVGDRKKKFIVKAELLNHPIFTDLLDKSAQEYGYEQQGVLRIPCRVLEFERILEEVRSNTWLWIRKID